MAHCQSGVTRYRFAGGEIRAESIKVWRYCTGRIDYVDSYRDIDRLDEVEEGVMVTVSTYDDPCRPWVGR